MAADDSDSSITLDRTDRQILLRLQEDGRISNKALAELVHLSPSACLARVRRLEQAGIIRGYRADLDGNLLGARLTIFLQLRLEGQGSDTALRAIATNEAVVQECHMISGNFDYLLKIRTADMAGFNRFYEQHIQRLPGLQESRTQVVLGTVCHDDTISLDGLAD